MGLLEKALDEVVKEKARKEREREIEQALDKGGFRNARRCPDPASVKEYIQVSRLPCDCLYGIH